MQTMTLAAAESSAGNPILNIAIFAAFLIVTMYVVDRKSTRLNSSHAR